jgi:hypothetical protein
VGSFSLVELKNPRYKITERYRRETAQLQAGREDEVDGKEAPNISELITAWQASRKAVPKNTTLMKRMVPFL